ncbi:protein of unknown function [Taphrina deformans PYCC 5710]|uniref:Structural maintenance of chromosomes protein n=1 Tax=Taphrina deformans (strain PYCC 5710 / ATCC 11124 / CBS 356.35 / IMI 108563 / JCM 9778 / NBRC 8474) TaxID=1097556 RepID=R4XGW7_TAPDE|nr:protein of unknown function [Taphrina deformans PYCC 5710]|eukprot:CCG83748.1 protein of unknown function [Taphrina deformans PYCC 5710]
MATRPSRRAVVTRKKIIVSDSDGSEAEDSQATPKRESRRTTVGSRTSFDDEYTPKKTRQSLLKTPVTHKVKPKKEVKKREPLSEARSTQSQSQSQSQIPWTATKAYQSTPGNNKAIPEGQPDVNDFQKENLPLPMSKLNLKSELLPPPPTLPLETLQKMRKIETARIDVDDTTLASNSVPEVPTGPKTRTVISKLVLENFKSYAGVQRIGPFHKSFSAVVGPNGSGKSNVIDSLLFVFGFRASKMRQGKISALIHNSAAHPDLGYCAVEVHFETIFDTDDPEDYRVVENSSIVVARKAYKNNSSKYTINDHDSSFTEVTTLLKDRGIDLDHKRFLILQGEVESIAQMRPKAANEHDDGLLEYLEDIIGTSKYKSPIEGALERMEALNEICQEKHSRVQIVEKERARLDEKKDIALQQIHAENELVVKSSALYQLFIAECDRNINLTQEVVQQLEGELNEGADSHKGNEDVIKSLEKKQKVAIKNQEELKSLLAKYTAEASQAEKASVSIQEKIKHLSLKQKKLAKSNSGAQFSLNESTLQLDNTGDELHKFKKELATLDTSLSKESQGLTMIRLSLKDKTQVFTDQIEVKQKQKQPWDAQISEKQSALEVAKSELDILNEKSSQMTRELESVTEQLKELEEAGHVKSKQIREIEAAITESKVTIANLTKRLSQLKIMEATAKSEHNGARDKADEARSNLSASKQKGDVLVGLTNLQETGRIAGFHGRLGDLGTIDDKYDIAITTACPSLNNMVVSNVDVGQQCIEHLRRNNLGRANFILLDKLPQRTEGTSRTPENVPRLVDLVRPRSSEYLAAFQKVLGNTVVANDLEQANRIAYGKARWRVVTLDGQLIEASGAMTGGGTRVSRGGMSSKFASSETKESVAKLDTLETKKRADLDKIQAEIRSLEAEMESLLQSAPAMETQKNRLTIELGAADKQVKDLKKRSNELASQNTASAIDTKRFAQIEKSIANHERAITKLSEETLSIEADIKDLQDRILDVGGIKLRTQQSKVDGLKDQIEALQQRADASEFSRTKAEKDIKKHSKTLENGIAELSAIEQDIHDFEAQLAQTTKGDTSTKEMEETSYALEENQSSLQEIKGALDEEMKAINTFRAKELELRNKLEDHTRRLLEDRRKSVHWHDKLSKLSIHELSEHFLTNGAPAHILTELSEDELEGLDKNELKAEIASLEETTANAKIETGVLEEYLKRCEEYAERAKALEEAVSERDLARNTAEDLRRRRLTEFMTGFNIISLRLKEMYQMITMGGNAELELVDSLDPFSEGILFSVMPPKKSWKNISNLSGGEKTLSSLALVFALHHYKPTPLYVMDEIDAALDFRNVSIVANYIKDRTKNAQFIVISLRNNMFELSARLIGIYKTSNMTKSIAIENTEIVMPAKKDQIQQSVAA